MLWKIQTIFPATGFYRLLVCGMIHAGNKIFEFGLDGEGAGRIPDAHDLKISSDWPGSGSIFCSPAKIALRPDKSRRSHSMMDYGCVNVFNR